MGNGFGLEGGLDMPHANGIGPPRLLNVFVCPGHSKSVALCPTCKGNILALARLRVNRSVDIWDLTDLPNNLPDGLKLRLLRASLRNTILRHLVECKVYGKWVWERRRAR